MMDERKYRLMCCQKQTELAMKDDWTDSDKLSYMLYGIQPYSRYWRWGMVKALKHAIKLLKEEERKNEVCNKTTDNEGTNAP